MNYKNKVVVITGAGSGIGKATALKFSSLSANLSIIDINTENLKSTAEDCKTLGAKVLTVTADLNNDTDVEKIVKLTLEEFNRIDVLVNCAGIALPGKILDPNLMESYDKTMSINLRAAVSMTNRVAPALIETKGSIINVSSIASLFVLDDFLAYNVSKAGMNHFTKCVALELASKGVRVNAILPGSVKTNLLYNCGLSQSYINENFKTMATNAPLKRIAEVEEIADLIEYLASEKAKSITGATFNIDNGIILVGIPPVN